MEAIMEPGMGSALAQFVPLIVVQLIFLAVAWPMAKRKGLGLVPPLLCVIPFLGGFVLIWIASKPDQALLDRLAQLEDRK
jgi:hypothetical protein